jgi:hypothetical protein
MFFPVEKNLNLVVIDSMWPDQIDGSKTNLDDR